MAIVLVEPRCKGATCLATSHDEYSKFRAVRPPLDRLQASGKESHVIVGAPLLFVTFYESGKSKFQIMEGRITEFLLYYFV